MLIRLLWNGRVSRTQDVVFLQRIHSGLRGPRNNSIQDLNRAWIEADVAIFERIRDTLPLEAYTVSRSISSDHEKRAALLQRGIVYARKKLWTYAIDDFSNAANLIDAPLTQDECAIVRKAVFSKYGCPELIADDSVYKQLCQRLLGSNVGDQIVANISRALLYHVRFNFRNGRLNTAFRFGWRVIQLASKTRPATRQIYGI